MTRVAFAELKMAQGEIREALHGIDAIGTRRPTPGLARAETVQHAWSAAQPEAD